MVIHNGLVLTDHITTGTLTYNVLKRHQVKQLLLHQLYFINLIIIYQYHQKLDKLSFRY